jgi:hypothetical protein
MIYSILIGGLGNQLFEIFAIIAYSLENKISFKFNINKPDKVSPMDKTSLRPTYWDSIFNSISKFTYYNNPNLKIYREPKFTYNKLPLFNNDTIITGYFQSEKYFKNQYENIIKLLNLNKIKENTKSKYISYFENKKLISIHFRIGDLKYNNGHGLVLNENYYINSLNTIKKKISDFDEFELLYFGEKNDDNIIKKFINEINKNFKNNYSIINYEIPDWEQLLMISFCEHNIISNSTFSWWGAYFNEKKEKIICYPSLWFRPDINNSTEDLFPENWIKIYSN